jgi:undecaprenyl diphosphate synthase
MFGHRMGAEAVRRTVREAANLGIEQLTLFAFSTENWSRPRTEVLFLMRLFRRFLREERDELRYNGIRLLAIGRLDEFPEEVRRELRRTIEFTRTGWRLTLCLALNYGGRVELVDACREIARRATAGELAIDGINEETLGGCMYQPDMPPLDLIIRTGGELRLSNFMLWQAAYAELWVTPVAWPEFGERHLRNAILHFLGRERRFGGLYQPGGKVVPPPAVELESGEISHRAPRVALRNLELPVSRQAARGGSNPRGILGTSAGCLRGSDGCGTCGDGLDGPPAGE